TFLRSLSFSHWAVAEVNPSSLISFGSLSNGRWRPRRDPVRVRGGWFGRSGRRFSMTWTKQTIAFVVGAAIGGLGLCADGVLIQFREGGGDGFVDTRFDDTKIVLDNATTDAYGNDGNIMINTYHRTYRGVGLMGIK